MKRAKQQGLGFEEKMTRTGAVTSALPRSRRKGIERLVVVLLAALGLGVLLYPMAGSWVSAATQKNDIQSYSRQVDQFPLPQKQQSLRDAQEYNDHIPKGQLRDPYANASSKAEATSEYKDYLKQLRVPKRPEIGRVTIPKIKVDLPIFHGTSEETLSRGVGHLYGSSLPVGGPGTHSVLSAHTGLPDATMFTDVAKLKKGDVFSVTVLDQTIYYKVDQIKVVLPTDVKDIQIVPGKDYITLETCTPINVNTHRLLVRGERIDHTDDPDLQHIGNVIDPAGFPWFILFYILGVGTVYILMYGRPKWLRSKKRSAEKPSSKKP